MIQKKLLFVGYGQLAELATPLFLEKDYHITGIARSDKASALFNVFPKNVEYWRGAVGDEHIMARLRNTVFDIVIITLTPSGRDPLAYQKAYVDNVKKLLAVWQQSDDVEKAIHEKEIGSKGKNRDSFQSCVPKKIFFVSSTRVYGQDCDEWVDELSETQPTSEQGQLILNAENALLNSHVDTTVVRFSGIYGVSRDFLIRQVKKGNLSGEHYTNRIHERDCVGFLLHLSEAVMTQQPVDDIYLASDNRPEKSCVVRGWLAQMLGVTFQGGEVSNTRPSSKRCKNMRMLATGYHLLFPTFEEGYSEFAKK